MSVPPGTRFLWVSQTRPAQPLTTLSGMIYYDYSYRPRTTKVHYTTTKTTKVVFYIHYEHVLNRVAATSAAASSSILYPKKTLPTTSSDGLFVCLLLTKTSKPQAPSPTATQPTPPAIRTSWNPSCDKCLACCVSECGMLATRTIFQPWVRDRPPAKPLVIGSQINLI
jgi:hypothetical protein